MNGWPVNSKMPRHCMEGLSYDPRLVVFEFISRLVLRKKQAGSVGQWKQVRSHGIIRSLEMDFLCFIEFHKKCSESWVKDVFRWETPIALWFEHQLSRILQNRQMTVRSASWDLFNCFAMSLPTKHSKFGWKLYQLIISWVDSPPIPSSFPLKKTTVDSEMEPQYAHGISAWTRRWFQGIGTGTDVFGADVFEFARSLGAERAPDAHISSVKNGGCTAMACPRVLVGGSHWVGSPTTRVCVAMWHELVM